MSSQIWRYSGVSGGWPASRSQLFGLPGAKPLTLKVGIFPEIDHLGGGWRRKQRGHQWECTDRASVTHGHPPWIRQWARAAAVPSAISSPMSRLSTCVYRKLRSEHINRQEPSEALAVKRAAPIFRSSSASNSISSSTSSWRMHAASKFQQRMLARADEVIE